MIVCSCNRLSDRAVRDVATQALPAPATPAKVYRALDCGPKCGRCADTIRTILADCASGCRAHPANGCERNAA